MRVNKTFLMVLTFFQSSLIFCAETKNVSSSNKTDSATQYADYNSREKRYQNTNAPDTQDSTTQNSPTPYNRQGVNQAKEQQKPYNPWVNKNAEPGQYSPWVRRDGTSGQVTQGQNLIKKGQLPGYEYVQPWSNESQYYGYPAQEPIQAPPPPPPKPSRQEVQQQEILRQQQQIQKQQQRIQELQQQQLDYMKQQQQVQQDQKAQQQNDQKNKKK